MPTTHDARGTSERLEQVLAEYLRAVEAGAPVDRGAFVARHPELAGELQSFFADRDWVKAGNDRVEAPIVPPGQAGKETTSPLRGADDATLPPFGQTQVDARPRREIGRAHV